MYFSEKCEVRISLDDTFVVGAVNLNENLKMFRL